MPTDTPPESESHLIAERRAKLDRLRERGNAFPNDFQRNATAEELHLGYGERTAEWLEAHPTRVSVAGRMMFKRVMGKASFAKVKDRSGLIQLFLQGEALGATYDEFKGWDVGDILGAEGALFKTRTGELSVKVDALRLLGEVAAAAARQVARARGRRAALSPALRGPHRQRRKPRRVPRAHADRAVPAPLPRRARFHGSRDADAAGDPGRRRRKAVHHAPQRARRGHVPAHRAGAVPEAPRGRRVRARLRDQPQFPQRGTVDAPQPRVHDARALPGVRGLPRPHGHGRAHVPGRGGHAVRRAAGRVPGRNLRLRVGFPPRHGRGPRRALQSRASTATA